MSDQHNVSRRRLRSATGEVLAIGAVGALLAWLVVMMFPGNDLGPHSAIAPDAMSDGAPAAPRRAATRRADSDDSTDSPDLPFETGA